jgi:hypothetical protein
VFFLRRSHANPQLRSSAKSHLRKSTAPECGHGFDGSLVETLGGNSDRVLDAFGVGEGDEAGADVSHRFIIGEGKANLRQQTARLACYTPLACSSGRKIMVMNMSIHIARIFSALVLVGASTAHADIISSNIEPGDLFGPGIVIGLVPFDGVFFYPGIGFTPSQNYVRWH